MELQMPDKTSERMDYVAIKNGNAYALMSADNVPADEVASFYRRHAEADEIKLMPVSEAVELHLRYLASLGVQTQK
jgi:hypothetical protein